MWFRRHIGICLEGVYYAVVLAFVLAGAMLRQMNLLMVLFGMLAAPLVLNLPLAWATLRRLDVRRKLPSSVSAGDLLVVELALTNPRRWLPSWAVVATDTIRREGAAPGGRPIAAETLFAHVGPGRARRVTYRGRLTERGRYQFGPLRIMTRYPFGLMRYGVTLDRPASLLVYPRLGRLTPRWMRFQQALDPDAGRAQARQSLLEGDFHGLRDWRPGDTRRWIHWRTSARRQTPVVRQFEQPRNPELALVLDLWRPAKPVEVDLENVELAVSCAATAAADCCRRGSRGLSFAIAAQQSHRLAGPSSSALLHEIMELLAVAEATTEDRLPDLLIEVLRKIPERTTVVVIATRPTDLADTERFRRLWSDPGLRGWGGRVRAIDVTQGELEQLFIAE